MKDTEREINLLDLFWYVCQKWRIIIASAIVFTIAFGILGAYKNITAKSVEEFDSESEFDKFSFIEQSRIKQYLYVENLYKKIVEKNDTDPLMSMDYENKYKTMLKYVIMDNDNSVVISDLLMDKLTNIWTISTGLDRFNEASIFYDSTSTVYSSNALENEQTKATVLSVLVYGASEEECNKSVKNVNKIVTDAYRDISDLFGDYKIKLTYNECFPTECESLKNYTNQKISEEHGWLTTLSGVNGTLSEAAKQYIKQYMESDSKENNEEIQVASSASDMINVKFILIGFILGIMAVCGIYGLLYIFNGKLRFEDDIDDIYGLNLLGKISSQKQKTKLDQFLNSMRRAHIHNFKYEEIIDIIASELKVMASKDNVNKIYVTGCSVTEIRDEIVKDLRTKLSNNKIEIISGKPILYFADALEESANVGNVLLIEKSKESSYLEIEQEINKAQSRGINIVGAVVVE